MSAFKHSAVNFGTSDTPPLEAGRNIGPISLHNAIEAREGQAEHATLGDRGMRRDSAELAVWLFIFSPVPSSDTS